jgi:uncharacterized membrane protein YeaQ/YmgE (transglycosylase-associated protein family)
MGTRYQQLGLEDRCEMEQTTGQRIQAFVSNLPKVARRLCCAASNRENREDHTSNESLLVILVVGLIAGWLAGQIIRGTGLGVVWDIIFGILGAFIGHWLLPRLGIHLGTGLLSAIVNATIGAMILLLIIGQTRSGGWRRRW